MSGSLKTGQSALIAANGTDSLINITSLLISFTLRKKHSAFICWSDTLTLHRREGGGPFYLSCRWTWVLLTGPGKATASGNGSLFKWNLSAFVLRQRSAYLSKRYDLRRLRCSIDHRPDPVVPDRVTRLQQHVKCMRSFFCFYFVNIPLCRTLKRAVFVLIQMTEDALIYSFSLVYLPTPIGNTVILKTNPTEVVIECHYQRYAQKTSTTSADAH